MSDQTEDQKPGDQLPIRLTISPEPVGDEGEALIAAVAVYLSEGEPDVEMTEEARSLSRWGAAGRRAATRGQNDDSKLGWGRRRAGWS